MLNIINSQGKKLNSPCIDIITYQLKWLKLKILTILNFGKDVGQPELSYTADRKIKW